MYWKSLKQDRAADSGSSTNADPKAAPNTAPTISRGRTAFYVKSLGTDPCVADMASHSALCLIDFMPLPRATWRGPRCVEEE